jgi:pimeloyl-ACP methyl ester carboxylesterase
MKFCLVLFLFFWQMKNAVWSQDIHFTVPVNTAFPNNHSVNNEVSDQYIVYHDQAILKLPPNYQADGAPVRLVYMAHGAGGGVSADSWYLNNFALQDSLLANGYAIFDVNGGRSVENMGGSMVIQAAYKAYRHIVQNYNVLPQIFVIGLSMGGCSSVNFVYKHSNVVLAHGMFSPVLDLKVQAWDNPWMKTTKKAIAEAYNFDDKTGNVFEDDKIIGWNPIMINTIIEEKDTLKIYPVPVKIWHGSLDRVVKVGTSRKFHQYIRNAGGFSELREVDSDDHGLSAGSPVLNRELLLFFRRFD